MHNLNYIYTINELYCNLEFKFKSNDLDNKMSYNLFSQINTLFSLFKFDLNNDEKCTLSLYESNNNELSFKLFSIDSTYEKKSLFMQLINDIRNENENISFAKKENIYLYLEILKKVSEFFEVLNIEEFNIVIDNKLFNLDNIYFIGYIFEELYNKIYARLDIIIKGENNKINPKTISTNTIVNSMQIVDSLQYSNNPNYKVELKASSFLIRLDIPKEDYNTSKLDSLNNDDFNTKNITIARSLEKILEDKNFNTVEIIGNNSSFKLEKNKSDNFKNKMSKYKNKSYNVTNNEFTSNFLFYATNTKTFNFTAFDISREEFFGKSFKLFMDSSELDNSTLNKFNKIITNNTYYDVNKFIEDSKKKIVSIYLNSMLCKIRMIKIKDRYKILHIEKL